MNFKKLTVATTVVAIIAIASAAMVILIKTKPESRKSPDRANVIGVRTTPAMLDDYTIEVTFPGRVVPREMVTLSSEVAGKLLESRIPLKVGQTFKRGDIIVDIFDEDERASHAAQVSAFLLTLATALPDMKLDIPDEFDKWAGFFTQIEVDKKLPELPEVKDAKEKVYLAAKGILSAYYNLLCNEIILDRYRIYAPFNGVYTSVSKEVGSVTTVNGEIARIASTGDLEMVVGVPLSSAQIMPVGRIVDVVSSSGKSYRGRIDRVAPYVESATQRVNIYISFTEPSMEVIGGQLLNITLPSEVISGVQELLRESVNNSKIYTVQDGKLKLREVEVIATTATNVYVKGLHNNDIIVNESLVSPYDGMEVRVLDIEGREIEK